MNIVPEVLRLEPRFRLLWGGQTLSVLGDLVTPVAMAFAVLSIGSTGDLALVVAAGLAPFAVFSVVGGVWADRIGRREVMLVSDIVRCVVQAGVAVLLLTGAAEVWMLVALAAVFGSAEAWFRPAMAGLIPETVSSERIQAANALVSLTQSVASIAGPLLAGVLVALSGPGEAIAFDAATFAVSAAFLAALPTTRRRAPAPAGSLRATADALRSPEEVPGAGGAGPPDVPFLQGLREGWGIVVGRRWLSAGLGAEAVYTLAVLPAIFVLGPVLAKQELNGASSWAIIVAGFGVGSVAGNLIALRWRPPRPMAAVALFLILASTQGAIIGSGLHVAGIAILEAVAGVGVALYWTLWDTTVQEQVPPDAVARVSSYDYGISIGLMPVGLITAVPVTEAIGLHATLRWMTVCGVVAALLLLAVPEVRALRRPEAQAEEEDGPGAPGRGAGPETGRAR